VGNVLGVTGVGFYGGGEFDGCILAYRSGNLGGAVSEVGKIGLPPWGGVGPIPWG
jgi:hypothetical protein